jgi:hypothetical protein
LTHPTSNARLALPLPLFPFPPTKGKYAKIHKLEFAAALKYSQNAKVWIAACAGMMAAG